MQVLATEIRGKCLFRKSMQEVGMYLPTSRNSIYVQPYRCAVSVQVHIGSNRENPKALSGTRKVASRQRCSDRSPFSGLLAWCSTRSQTCRRLRRGTLT